MESEHPIQYCVIKFAFDHKRKLLSFEKNKNTKKGSNNERKWRLPKSNDNLEALR